MIAEAFGGQLLESRTKPEQNRLEKIGRSVQEEMKIE